MLRGDVEKLKDLFTEKGSEHYLKIFVQHCYYRDIIDKDLMAEFLAVKVLNLVEYSPNWWRLDIILPGYEEFFETHWNAPNGILRCFTSIDEPINKGDIIYGYFSFKSLLDSDGNYYLSVQIPNGYTTSWDYGYQSFDFNIIDSEFSLKGKDYIWLGHNLSAYKIKLPDDSKEELKFIKEIEQKDSYKTIMTKKDLNNEKEWSLYQLNSLLHDIDMVPEKEIPTLHISGNGSLIETKNQDKRLMIKNEPKLYFLTKELDINGRKFGNSKQILIRKGAEKLYKEIYRNSLIELVNKKAEEFLSKKFELEKDKYGNGYIFKLLRVKPELVSDERQPKGVRKTIDMFIFLNYKTHQPISDTLYYEDFTKSKHTYKEIRGKMNELYES